MQLLGGFAGVDSWNTWFGWLKEIVGKVNGSDVKKSLSMFMYSNC